MSTADDVAGFVIDTLERLGAPYMLVGAFSANQYAIPRATKDADFVVGFESIALNEIAAALKPRIRMDPQIRFETILGTTRYVFYDEATRFCVELFELSDDPHDRLRFERRRRALYGDRQTWIPTAEDVIIMKLRWAKRGSRGKDFDDAENVIAVQAGKLDWEYLHHWTDEHGTRELLDGICAKLKAKGLI